MSLVGWALDPGTVVAGRYRVDERLGQGAAATVYRAHDDVRNETVALKVLDDLRAADPVGQARFARELEALGRLSHPGVSRCLGHERTDGLDVLVLEHLDGETLEARLERGRLPVYRAVEHALCLADALSTVHAAGVLHRDLKPANVVLHPERGPVILDLGLAWFSAAATLTRTGAVLGSPQYLAPESFRSSQVDSRADLWSLGALLFEMLAGRPVYLADDVAELAHLHATREPPSVAALRPHIPPRLDRVVRRALAPDPAERFATAEELGAALRGEQDWRESASAGHCRRCRTRLAPALAFCPGCGDETDPPLSPGRHTVRLLTVPDPEQAVAWLQACHRSRLRGGGVPLDRLWLPPVVLARRIARASASRLVEEAAAVGAAAEVKRSRRLALDAGLPSATTRGALAAVGAHVLAVAVLGGLLGWARVPLVFLGLLPAAVGLAGWMVVRLWLSRPLLRPNRGARSEARTDHEAVRQRLAGLETPRAKALAARAVHRAAPALTGDIARQAAGAPDDVAAALEEALSAAEAVDAHAARLEQRPRARLTADLETARAAEARGEPGAVARVHELEEESRELAAAGTAHDLEARRALEATAAISVALSSRVTLAEIDAAAV